MTPTSYADATVIAVAEALDDLLRTGGLPRAGEPARFPSGVDSWVRAFTVTLADRERPNPRRRDEGGGWQVIAPRESPLASRLRTVCAERGAGGGVMVCLPLEPDERHVGLLLEGARAALAERRPTRFALVQHGGGAASFARTLHLEAPTVTVSVVDVPFDHPEAATWVVDEACAATGYTEAHYDASGRRREPVLRLLETEPDDTRLPLGPDDVLLVTGGGKGIAAECALALARKTGASLALLGRSEPASDPQLTENLERVAGAGVQFRYVRADVTDAAAVRAAVAEVETCLGRVTGILHGAGTNVPRLLAELDADAFARTLAPKVQGARNVLAAVDGDRLRLFVTFGSVIARAGMRGEADYALANEWLSRLTERVQAQHPACRCLALEWSVWSGIGMGERLGRVDALRREGITPISPDEGVKIFLRLLAQTLPGVSVVVTGRFGDTPTLRLERPELPFVRFLERPRVDYPGVEVVAEAELAVQSDPYLNDHVFCGERLLPAVIGLEAMAQAASALFGAAPSVFEDVAFHRPIVAPPTAAVRVRVAALRREPDRVDVALRSDATAFQVDHFQATCRIGAAMADAAVPTVQSADPPRSIGSIDPARDLYGSLLFHAGRFRRLAGYRRLAATECVAEIGQAESRPAWFARYLPADLLLGDPAARDAALHAIQACIPHVSVLPAGVERIAIHRGWPDGRSFVHARERSRDSDTLVWDLVITDDKGRVLERWEGLRLRLVERRPAPSSWNEALLPPYVERRLAELIPGAAVRVALEGARRGQRRWRSDAAMRRALDTATGILRRPDGKPDNGDGRAVSAAHAADLTLAVAGLPPIACDLEPVARRLVEGWPDLLGLERYSLAEVIAREASEDLDTAATRVWAASECLTKAGAGPESPLVLASSTQDRWVVLGAGPRRIATLVASIGDRDPLALAVLVASDGSGARTGTEQAHALL